jgi:hypothetical protein
MSVAVVDVASVADFVVVAVVVADTVAVGALPTIQPKPSDC